MSSKNSPVNAKAVETNSKDTAAGRRGSNQRACSIHKWQWLILSVFSTALVMKYSPQLSAYFVAESNLDLSSYAPVCPQVESRLPAKHTGLHTQLKDLYGSEKFKLQIVELLSGAVQVPTESHDGMGAIGEDPRWEIFGQFHDYLRNAFPLTHEILELTKVNTYGLVYHWQGRDRSLKPLLLTAHQDVVPIDPSTIDEWIHEPYSGFYDGTYIWGRGSIDDKSPLITIMSTIEALIDNGFRPDRSIVLAFGFDEEVGGQFGARKISEYLLEVYGENGFALLIDEGGNFMTAYGSAIINPSTSEKGYLNMGVEVHARGGHSSQPPDHTSIGIISHLLVALEENSPQPRLLRSQAAYETIQCLVHTAGIPASLKNDIVQSQTSDEALARVQEAILADLPGMKYLIRTTQAIDFIRGGVKVNALPEQATAVVNYRVDTASSVNAVKEHVFPIFKAVADRHNLSLDFFGDVTPSSGLGQGNIVVFDFLQSAFEPAPTSPTGNVEPWSLLSSTIRATIDEAIVKVNQSKLVIAPGVGSFNTDTRFYWRLTPNIFRYSPFFRPNAVYSIAGLHSVNEAVSAVALTDQIRFFTLLILNADESKEM